MGLVISVIKARVAFLAVLNAAIHILALVGKGADTINPDLMSASFDTALTTVVGVTGTLGLAFPGLAKYIKFTDTQEPGKVA